MSRTEFFGGANAAMLTLYDGAGAVDSQAMAEYGKWLLGNGISGLLLFGTTGEGPSLSVHERRDTLSAMIASGIPPERLIVGALGTSLSDVISLVAATGEARCAGALVMPPYYFTAAPADGILSFFNAVIEQTTDAATRIMFYHFPEMSGIANVDIVIDGLLRRHSGRFLGIKDSSGSHKNTLNWIQKYRDVLEIYTGDDDQIVPVLLGGGAGSMTAAAGLLPALAASIATRHVGPSAEFALSRFWCDILLKSDVIAAIRSTMAHYSGDGLWLETRPPLMPLTTSAEKDLLEGIKMFADKDLSAYLSQISTLSLSRQS